jgi:hypothetical protein
MQHEHVEKCRALLVSPGQDHDPEASCQCIVVIVVVIVVSSQFVRPLASMARRSRAPWAPSALHLVPRFSSRASGCDSI